MTKRAVIVGIDNYRQADPTGGSDLSKCVNDARSMYTILKNSFGFSKIYTYLDNTATKSKIINALRYLVSISEAGDTICFYYSGHGTRIRTNLANRDCDSYYEALYLGNGALISDREMSQIAAPLYPEAVNFTVILDSCHSGGMHPGDAVQKCLPFNNELIQIMIENLKTIIPFGLCLGDHIDALVGNVSNVRPNAMGGVDLDPDPDKTFLPAAKTTLLSGCRFNEFSYIGPNTYSRSIFTQCLYELIFQSNFEASHNFMIEKIRDSIQQKIRNGHFPAGERQTPQLYGQRNRMEGDFLKGYNFTPALP